MKQSKNTIKTNILRKYKPGLKAEEKKKIFHGCLFNYTVSRRLPRYCIRPSLVFCLPETHKYYETFFAKLVKKQTVIKPEQIVSVLKGMDCAIDRDTDLGRVLADISTGMNKIAFLARLKALKQRVNVTDKKVVINLLLKLVNKESVLYFAINFFLDQFVDLHENKRLACLLLGFLKLDPHMWSRSLVMLECLKVSFEQLIVRYLLKTKRDIKSLIRCDVERYVNMYRNLQPLGQDPYGFNENTAGSGIEREGDGRGIYSRESDNISETVKAVQQDVFLCFSPTFGQQDFDGDILNSNMSL